MIILLGGVAWIGSHQLDPAQAVGPLRFAASNMPPLEVQAVSLDWKWLFIYPNQGIASVNELVLPAAMPVHFALTSASVMNAFFVPRLGSMIYTMNGMTTQLNLRADAPGTFRGLSSNYSGDGFSDMHFAVARDAGGPVRRVDREDPGNRADARRQQLCRADQTDARRASVYLPRHHAGLFQQIVTLQLPPGPGP